MFLREVAGLLIHLQKRKMSVRSFALYMVERDQICERFPYCALHLLAIRHTMRSWPLLKYFSLCTHFELSVIWNSHPVRKWLPAISLLKLCESSLAKSTFGVDVVLFLITSGGGPNPLADILGGGPNPFPPLGGAGTRVKTKVMRDYTA